MAPLSGDSFHLLLPGMEADRVHLFLQELKQPHPNDHVVVVWDNAPCHRRKDLRAIDGLTLVPLPPYAPQLSPAERFFEAIRRSTANRGFDDLAAQEDRICEGVNRWSGDP